jgi:hypothetical protein
MSAISYIVSTPWGLDRPPRALIQEANVVAVPWILVTVLVALLFAGLAVRAALPRRGDDGVDQEDEAGGGPLAPLQQAAWWTLAAGAAFTAAVVAAIARNGAQAFWTDAGVRLPVTGLMLAALVASLVPMLVARRRAKSRVLVDERDLEILARAPRVQGAAALVCLALWTVALMETFRSEGQVPMAFVVLVFWSCLLAHALALPVGILLGYRRR